MIDRAGRAPTPAAPFRPTVADLMALVALLAACLALPRLGTCVGSFAVVLGWLACRVTADEIRQRRARGRPPGALAVAGVFLAAGVLLAVILLVPAVVALGLVIACGDLVRTESARSIGLAALGSVGAVVLAAWLAARLVRRLR